MLILCPGTVWVCILYHQLLPSSHTEIEKNTDRQTEICQYFPPPPSPLWGGVIIWSTVYHRQPSHFQKFWFPEHTSTHLCTRTQTLTLQTMLLCKRQVDSGWAKETNWGQRRGNKTTVENTETSSERYFTRWKFWTDGWTIIREWWMDHIHSHKWTYTDSADAFEKHQVSNLKILWNWSYILKLIKSSARFGHLILKTNNLMIIWILCL